MNFPIIIELSTLDNPYIQIGSVIKPRMKICKNPSDAEFYGESNGEIKNGV